MENIKKIRRVSTGIFDHGPAADQKELRMQYGPHKAISDSKENSKAASVRPGSRPQAPSLKLQASSTKRFKLQAASLKPQAASVKLQAASVKLHDP